MAKDGKKRKAAQEAQDSESEVPLTTEEVADLAQALTKEQLVTLAKDAALAHADVRSKLRKFADEDPAARKLFVRGINFSTDKDGLRKAFEGYGPLKDAVVVVDKATGKNRGFGFVTFKHREGAFRALKEPNKTIDGRSTTCHLSGARDSEAGAAASLAPTLLQVTSEALGSSLRKIYVANVPKTIQKATLKTFFSQYGEIEEGPLGWDKKTGKCKGYALFVFKSAESVRKCLLEPNKTLEGHKMQVKLADTQKEKEDRANAGLSGLGYDVTNPALIASHNPSFLHSGSHVLGRLPSELSALHGLSGGLLGRESALGAGSLSSMYGLPLGNSLAGSHPSLAALHDVHGLGFSSLPRGATLY